MPSPAAPGIDATECTAPPVAGLLLAAGAGRRMGRPKALIRSVPDGPTLVERGIGALRVGGCAQVVVIVGAAAHEVGELARAAGAAVVEAAGWAGGMGFSLRAGLDSLQAGWSAAAADSPAAALVLLVDLPDIGPDVVARVLATAAGPSAHGPPVERRLARAAYDGRPGHPVLIGRDHWPAAMTAASGDRGARDFLADAKVSLIECGDLATGRDADTPSDLDER
ncbi:MAG: nucleotidyltransferase family protein [Tetrasphaera sp.]